MDNAIKIFEQNNLSSENKVLLATGGGAYKFADQLKSVLGLNIEKRDEIACLLTGLNFML